MLQKKFALSLSRNLTCRLAQAFLSEKKSDDHDLVFIRHAESMYNRACEEYRLAHGIPYAWKTLCSHEGFDERVLFNYEFVDTRLTDKGKQECRKTRQLLDSQDIDCVLVSPQTRALETYQETLGHRGIPTFAEPLLTGPLRSCVDLSRPTVSKLNQFPGVNFQAMNEQEDLWFLDHLPFQKQYSVIQRLEQKNLKSFRERCEQLLKMMQEQVIHEDAFQYRQRVQKAKLRLAEYRAKYRNIAVVGHYYTVEYMSAKQYLASGEPASDIDIKNCMPYYARLDDLLSVKEENFLEVAIEGRQAQIMSA